MKASPPSCARSAPAGFTLVELLAVLAILAILLALAIPPSVALLTASGVSNAGDQMLSSLSLARQIATSRNRAVEVRLYRYHDPARAGQPAEGRFQAIQLFLIEPTPSGTSTNAASRKQSLPANAYIASDPALSSLLDPARFTPVPGSELGQTVPPVGTNYSAVRFRFRPDGSTTLPSDTPMYLTMVPATTPDTASAPPANFATIVLQASSGKASLHRP